MLMIVPVGVVVLASTGVICYLLSKLLKKMIRKNSIMKQKKHD